MLTNYYRMNNKDQLENLKLLETNQLRGKNVLDVGCGGGSFLDLVKGFASNTIGIELTKSYHLGLSRNNHHVYSHYSEAMNYWQGAIDLAVCFLTIEHIDDPVFLLKEIKLLLRDKVGKVIFTTPNYDDWLIEFLPGVYDRFFFRLAHSWYFNGFSLQRTLEYAGFSDIYIGFLQTYDISNALLWIRDRRPTGLGAIDLFHYIDDQYKAVLESMGRSNIVYAECRV